MIKEPDAIISVESVNGSTGHCNGIVVNCRIDHFCVGAVLKMNQYFKFSLFI